MAIAGQNGLLEVHKEGLKFGFIGRPGEIHHPAIYQTLANSANHRAPHLPIVSLVEHGLVSGAPGAFRHRVGGVCGFIDPDQSTVRHVHQIPDQSSKCSPKLKHPLRLSNVLAIHGFTRPERDVTRAVEGPDRMSADDTVHLSSQ